MDTGHDLAEVEEHQRGEYSLAIAVKKQTIMIILISLMQTI